MHLHTEEEDEEPGESSLWPVCLFSECTTITNLAAYLKILTFSVFPGMYLVQDVSECHLWHVQLVIKDALNKLGVNSIIIEATSSVFLS